MEAHAGKHLEEAWEFMSHNGFLKSEVLLKQKQNSQNIYTSLKVNWFLKTTCWPTVANEPTFPKSIEILVHAPRLIYCDVKRVKAMVMHLKGNSLLFPIPWQKESQMQELFLLAYSIKLFSLLDDRLGQEWRRNPELGHFPNITPPDSFADGMLSIHRWWQGAAFAQKVKSIGLSPQGNLVPGTKILWNIPWHLKTWDPK